MVGTLLIAELQKAPEVDRFKIKMEAKQNQIAYVAAIGSSSEDGPTLYSCKFVPPLAPNPRALVEPPDWS